jgi:hypothetical protein
LWAAVTESLATRISERPRPQDFAAVGRELRESIVFSYLYLSDGQRIFTPSYEHAELKWADLPDSEFRAMFADSQLSTQISANGSAKDGTLHEIEFVRQYPASPWSSAKRTLLCGVGWALADGVIANGVLCLEHGAPVLSLNHGRVPLFEALTLGGERNYGFGRVMSISIPELLQNPLLQLWPVEPGIRARLDSPLLGHAPYDPDLAFKGDVEMIAAREYRVGFRESYRGPGASISNAGYFFVPGTVLPMEALDASFDAFGRITVYPESSSEK